MYKKIPNYPKKVEYTTRYPKQTFLFFNSWIFIQVFFEFIKKIVRSTYIFLRRTFRKYSVYSAGFSEKSQSYIVKCDILWGFSKFPWGFFILLLPGHTVSKI